MCFPQVDHLTDFLQQNTEQGGLFPMHFALSNSQPAAGKYSVGAEADSAYEYLLKQWLMTNKTESHFLDMCKSTPSQNVWSCH